MKIIFSSFVLAVGGSTNDPCSRLCQFDGPQICTGGSWIKGNDICHAYYYNEDGHCYHTASTKTTCPASGRPVKGNEVDGIIASRRERNEVGDSTTAAPSTTTTTAAAEDSLTTDATRTIPPEMEAWMVTTTVEPLNPFPIDDSELDVSNLVDSPENANANSLIRLIVEEFPRPGSESDIEVMSFFISKEIISVIEQGLNRDADPVSEFNRLKGRVLLNLAARPDVSPAVVILPFLLGMNIAMIDPTSRDRFLEESGLNKFPKLFPEKLSLALLTHHEHMKVDRVRVPSQAAMILAAVMSSVPIYFPDLFESSLELRIAYAVDWLWWSMPNRPKANGIQIRAQPESSFADVVPLIMQSSPVMLRALVSVESRHDREYGFGPRRQWFSRASETVFRTEGENALFVTRNDGLYVLRTTASEDQYTLLGRFLAMCVINEEPIGISFPLIYIARLLGVPLTLDEFETEDPMLARSMRVILNAPEEALDLLPLLLNGETLYPTVENREQLVHEGINSISSPDVEEKLYIVTQAFQSVIEPGTLSGMLNVTELANWFLGTPLIDVEEMIEVMDRETVLFEDDDVPVMDWLFEHLRTMDQAGLRRFYRFVTGSSIVPFGGFGSVIPPIHMELENDSEELPSSVTCFRRLNLPRYESKEILVAKLTLALTRNE